MLQLTRLFMLIAVAILVAQPVMACCIAGHGEPALSQAHDDVLPCHDEKPAADQTVDQTHEKQLPPADCPGCLDCDRAVMEAQSADNAALLAQAAPEISVEFLVSSLHGFEHKPTVFKTGPPREPELKRPTPITLKQRLLI